MISWLYLPLLAALDSGAMLGVLDNETTEAGPGVAAVVIADGNVAFSGARGLADIEARRPLSVDTPMYAGSLSKVFTAMIILKLVDEGRLSLEENPDFGQPDTMRAPFDIRMLLSHASGLPREGNFGYWFSGHFPDEATLRQYVVEQLPEVRPSSKSSYSNIGFAVLGLTAAEATGRSYPSLLADFFAEPLGLTKTGGPGPTPAVARGYSPANRLIPSARRPFAGVGAKVGERHLREYHDASAMTPAFGIFTSARDLGRVARFLLDETESDVLPLAMRERMREGQESGWGLGLDIGTLEGNEVATHSGWFAAHRSYLLLDAGNDVGIVVIANSDDAVPARVAGTLYRLALANDVPVGSGE